MFFLTAFDLQISWVRTCPCHFYIYNIFSPFLIRWESIYFIIKTTKAFYSWVNPFAEGCSLLFLGCYRLQVYSYGKIIINEYRQVTFFFKVDNGGGAPSSSNCMLEFDCLDFLFLYSKIFLQAWAYLNFSST